jgi:hypothetical protein
MRTLPVAIAVSVALHGAAIAYVRTRPRPKPEPPPEVTTIEIVPAAPPEPMVVALLDDHTPVKELPAPATDPRAPQRMAVSGASGGLKDGKTSWGNSAGTQGEGGLKDGKTSSLMHMRGAGDHDPVTWTPSGAFDAAFAANEKPPDIPPPASGELHPGGGGTFTSDHPAFKVKVDRDGTAHIEDKPDVGDVHVSGLGIAGRASFDDWIMRKAGIDPYSSAKRQWLDKTRDERARIAMTNRKEDLARAPEFMRRNLAWAWKRTEADPDARKQALFELWDECAETGDRDLVAAGTAARAYLVGFIRAHLARGKPGAFTGDDLARLNAHRRSKATFEPY